MMTLTKIEMERLNEAGLVYLWRRPDRSLFWDYSADETDTMVAGLSDAWDADAECFPDVFTFERTVENG
jgi:hypothetical protein